MRRVLALSTAATAGALALPAIAVADLPRTSSSTIVPGVSIGGVKVSDTFARATTTWGASDGDCYQGQCLFRGTPEEGRAVIAGFDRKLSLSLELGFTDGRSTTGAAKPNLQSPLTRYKTSKGIRLGSSVSALKAAYGKRLIRRVVGVGQGYDYVLIKRKNSRENVETVFFPYDRKTITVIRMAVVLRK